MGDKLDRGRPWSLGRAEIVDWPEASRDASMLSIIIAQAYGIGLRSIGIHLAQYLRNG